MSTCIFQVYSHSYSTICYDVEVVKESTFHEWREQDIELPGRGVALQSVKPFFEWLEQADLESDEGGT